MKPKTNPRLWADLHNPYRYRDDNLKAMGFASYQAYLESPLWLDIRARAMMQAESVCGRCGLGRNLQVHHRAYDPATLAGTCLDALTVICRRCHQRAERSKRWNTPYDHFQQVNRRVMRDQKSWRPAMKASTGATGAPRLVKAAK